MERAGGSLRRGLGVFGGGEGDGRKERGGHGRREEGRKRCSSIARGGCGVGLGANSHYTHSFPFRSDIPHSFLSWMKDTHVKFEWSFPFDISSIGIGVVERCLFRVRR